MFAGISKLNRSLGALVHLFFGWGEHGRYEVILGFAEGSPYSSHHGAVVCLSILRLKLARDDKGLDAPLQCFAGLIFFAIR